MFSCGTPILGHGLLRPLIRFFRIAAATSARKALIELLSCFKLRLRQNLELSETAVFVYNFV